MGMIKSALISLQMIPWCFPTRSLIWNHISCAHLRPEESAVVGRTIKLIKSDGIVKIYHQPINASDLMMEFPKHLVCHSDSFYIGQKIQPLSPNDKLQLGHKYFLLPNHFFQSVLSFVTIASFAAASSSSSSSSSIPPQSSLNISSSRTTTAHPPIISNSTNKNDFLKKVATNCQPFDIRKTPSGSLQIRVSDEFISKLMEENRDQQLVVVDDDDDDQEKKKSAGSSRVCTTTQLQKDYSQLVGSRQWKPKLETITESKRRPFGIHRIRNYNKQSKSHHHHHQIQPKGYSSSSSTQQQQQLMKIHKSSDHQYLHHHRHHHVTAAASSSSPPAAHPSKIKVIKTKGRKICKF